MKRKLATKSQRHEEKEFYIKNPLCLRVLVAEIEEK